MLIRKKGNLIYLGVISGRVPIIPPFVAYHHIGESSSPISHAEAFVNLPV
jgi:hypothetical protein